LPANVPFKIPPPAIVPAEQKSTGLEQLAETLTTTSLALTL
jgi:hypothetical protein